MAIALSLPPFGWWPLGIVGLGVVTRILLGQPARRRAAMGAAVGVGQFAVGLWWVTALNVAGYVALVLLSMAFMAAALAAVFGRRPGAVLAGLPAALTLAEWARGQVPFGGLPLGGIPLGQAAGPMAFVARLGGPLLLTGATAAAGAAGAILAMAVAARPRAGVARPAVATAGRRAGGARPAAAAAGRRAGGARPAVAAALVLAAVVALVAAGHLGPDGSGGNGERPIRVAAVQGGGARGLHALDTDAQVVFQRQVDATATLRPPVDLVVWPEDVVRVDQPVGATPEAAAIAQLARLLRATVVAGVVENVGPDHFRNAAVAWSPDGVIVARYDKVHRVPFGEYVPGRGFFRHLANLQLVPRDAVAGHGVGLLDTPAGPLGTVISYEVFYEDRARSAAQGGGELLVVPTNASSYRTSQVPAQEVAAAQLRAIETGRDTVQAAPTGYSALIDHNGRVLARSTLGRREAVTGVLRLRSGQTWFVRYGDLPVLVLAILGLIAPLWPARRPGSVFPSP